MGPARLARIFASWTRLHLVDGPISVPICHFSGGAPDVEGPNLRPPGRRQLSCFWHSTLMLQKDFTSPSPPPPEQHEECPWSATGQPASAARNVPERPHLAAKFHFMSSARLAHSQCNPYTARLLRSSPESREGCKVDSRPRAGRVPGLHRSDGQGRQAKSSESQIDKLTSLAPTASGFARVSSRPTDDTTAFPLCRFWRGASRLPRSLRFMRRRAFVSGPPRVISLLIGIRSSMSR